MAFGSFNPSRPHQMMSDINVTPMVDVMLVLLVIFIITAPMFTHAVKLDLPKAQASAAQPPADMVTISIDADGKIFWNNEGVTPQLLDQRLMETAKSGGDPELQLRADKETRYEAVAQVMAAAQSHGLGKLAFVTEPVKENARGKN
jgi:biopolymer transport protein ExbD